MAHRTRWLALAVAGALFLAAAGVTASKAAPAGPTIAEFVTALANQGNTGDPVSTDEALKQLRRFGIVVKDPNAPLTEGLLSRIMRTLGYRATTGNPDATVDFYLNNAALALCGGSWMSGARGNSGGVDAPLDIGVCLSEKNPGQCQKCCLGQGSPGAACTRFCSALVPSESVPN